MFRRIGVFVVGIILLYLLFHHFISPQRISSEIYESVYIKQVRKLNNILAQCPNTNIKNYLANFTTCPTTSNVHQLILTLEKYCQTNKANTCKTPQDGVRLLSEDSDMYSDFVNYGGWWMPTDCVERDSTAIVIPLSPWNELRFKYLSTLLRNLHPILRHQKLHYRIFVVVQDAQSAYNRDPDVIPRDATVPYDCSASPMYIPLVNQSTHEAGGVFMFRTHHYNKVNGFPNSLFTGYLSGGGEDEVMLARLKYHKLKLHQHPSVFRPMRDRTLNQTSAKYARAREYTRKAHKNVEKGVKGLKYFIVDLNARDWVTFVNVDAKRKFWY